MPSTKLSACSDGVSGAILAYNELLKSQSEIGEAGYYITLLSTLFMAIFLCFTVRIAVKKIDLIKKVTELLPLIQGGKND